MALCSDRVTAVRRYGFSPYRSGNVVAGVPVPLFTGQRLSETKNAGYLFPINALYNILTLNYTTESGVCQLFFDI